MFSCILHRADLKRSSRALPSRRSLMTARMDAIYKFFFLSSHFRRILWMWLNHRINVHHVFGRQSSEPRTIAMSPRSPESANGMHRSENDNGMRMRKNIEEFRVKRNDFMNQVANSSGRWLHIFFLIATLNRASTGSGRTELFGRTWTFSELFVPSSSKQYNAMAGRRRVLDILPFERATCVFRLY